MDEDGIRSQFCKAARIEHENKITNYEDAQSIYESQSKSSPIHVHAHTILLLYICATNHSIQRWYAAFRAKAVELGSSGLTSPSKDYNVCMKVSQPSSHSQRSFVQVEPPGSRATGKPERSHQQTDGIGNGKMAMSIVNL